MKLIRVSQSDLNHREIFALAKVLKRNHLGMGPVVQKFENELSRYFGSEAKCVSNGTAAIQLALQALGIGNGDEVLVPSFTYIATFQAISATGAVPIPCEINEDSLQINLDMAQKRVTARTKALIAVTYGGSLECLKPSWKFAQSNGIVNIIDAAHSFGSKLEANKYIDFCDVACFSFDGIKIITSGEGGCVTSSNSNLLNKISDLRLLGVIGDSIKRSQMKRSFSFNVEEQGWRYHMSDINAAIGLVQLKKIEKFRYIRQELYSYYNEILKDFSEIKIPSWNNNNLFAPFIYPVRIVTNVNKDKLIKSLLKKGIQTGIHYKPNHLLTKYQTEYRLPITEIIFSQILTLPLHTKLSKKDVRYICNSLINEIRVNIE